MPSSDEDKTLHLGARGDAVRLLQQQINALGFNAGEANGVFGPKTLDAVKAFQRSQGLVADGLAGPELRRRVTSLVGSFPLVSSKAAGDSSLRTGGSTASALIQGFDASIRINQYVGPAKQLAQRLLTQIEEGVLSHLDARVLAVEQRNALLNATRQQLSPGGRAFSRALKEEGKTLVELLPKYALKVLEKTPALIERYGLKTLEAASSEFNPIRYKQLLVELESSVEVSRAIIEAAGRTGKAVTALARFSRVAGPVGAGIGFALSGYEIMSAPEGRKAYTAGREASGLAGGLVGSVGGGLVGAWVASLACGPGAPVCGIIVSVVAVGGSAFAGGALFESGYENLLGPATRDGAMPLKPGTYLGNGEYLDSDMIVRQGMGPKF